MIALVLSLQVKLLCKFMQGLHDAASMSLCRDMPACTSVPCMCNNLQKVWSLRKGLFSQCSFFLFHSQKICACNR